MLGFASVIRTALLLAFGLSPFTALAFPSHLAQAPSEASYQGNALDRCAGLDSTPRFKADQSAIHRIEPYFGNEHAEDNYELDGPSDETLLVASFLPWLSCRCRPSPMTSVLSARNRPLFLLNGRLTC
jgi:hypothetical protein